MQPTFESSYQTLPERFYVRTEPSPVREPALIRVNGELALELGLDPSWLAGADGVAMLAGNAVPHGARPVALAYAGHQFGQFVPQLGDGRAVLLGEITDVQGRRRDIQLKGSGRTAYSRGGDGRAALGPVLREYLVSEAMAALGIPTTRALAAITTGEHVYRETRLPGAVLARVAASHIRIGTFRHRAALPASPRRRSTISGAAARRHRSASASCCQMDAGRLRSWRDEHRQHGHLRRDDRLWPMCFHRQL
jgi:serine/tyrosine/threonine adenylyltransferase